jgi:alginate O-acetyltransferase complex protein AlgI
MPQFSRRETWRWHTENFTAGLSLFAFGLFKKVVFADTLSPIAGRVFGALGDGATPGLVPAWTGALAYTLQLYFDFSGYSDMALGLARMFNVRFPLNFNSPYKARDIADFWRRWHISLSTFLRDHLYIPLGGNRLGGTRRHFNLLVTMLLGGLWHGAGWTFVVWGGLHGVYLVVHQLWAKVAHGLPWAASRPAALLGWAITQLAVVVGWVFFRAHSLGEAVTMLEGMAGSHGLTPMVRPADLVVIVVTGLIAILAPNTEEIFRLAERSTSPEHPARWALTRRWALATAAVFAISVLHLSGVTEFLYFQF